MNSIQPLQMTGPLTVLRSIVQPGGPASERVVRRRRMKVKRSQWLTVAVLVVGLVVVVGAGIWFFSPPPLPAAEPWQNDIERFRHEVARTLAVAVGPSSRDARANVDLAIRAQEALAKF